MNGLHQRIASKLAEIASCRATLADADASPEASHDAFERVPRFVRELEELCQSAHTGENAAAVMGALIGKLHASSVKSAEMMLCIRDLETAGFRLRQHLGTEPEPSKPTIQAD